MPNGQLEIRGYGYGVRSQHPHQLAMFDARGTAATVANGAKPKRRRRGVRLGRRPREERRGCVSRVMLRVDVRRQ